MLWAVEHAPNEYTLLLGNGRDLVTVDAASSIPYRGCASLAVPHRRTRPTLCALSPIERSQ